MLTRRGFEQPTSFPIVVAWILWTTLVVVGGGQAATAATQCAANYEQRVLSWSDSTNTAEGAVWSGAQNRYPLGEGFWVTVTLSDTGPMDTPSTLENSGVLEAASPTNGGTLIWNIDTVSAGPETTSTLLFEFSDPVVSWSTTVIDIDAKVAEPETLWQDQVSAYTFGEGVRLTATPANDSAVTSDGSTVWAADGSGRVANDSTDGNVNFTANGQIFSAGLAYNDGPRSVTNPEQHAVGLSSVTVCVDPNQIGIPGGEKTDEPDEDQPVAEDPTASPTTESALPIDGPDGLNPETEPFPTDDADATAGQLTIENVVSKPASNGATSYSLVQTITARNDGDSMLHTTRVFGDLGSLEAAESWNIEDVDVVAGSCVAVPDYDRTNTTALLAEGSELAPGQTCQLAVTVEVTPATESQNFAFGAHATASSQGIEVQGTNQSAGVTLSTRNHALAHTGPLTEAIAASATLTAILGVLLVGYRRRFLTTKLSNK